MVKQYAKQEQIIKLLNEGWEIFTERGTAPYKPLYFHIYAPEASSNEFRFRIHPLTIQSLIRKRSSMAMIESMESIV